MPALASEPLRIAKSWRTEQSSALQTLAGLSPREQRRVFRSMGPDQCERLLPIKGPEAWAFWARGKQYWRPSPADIVFYSAGRGWGKTLTGACAMNLVARDFPERFGWNALVVGRTAADIRDVMVNGPSGIMATADPAFAPKYEPSKRLITWPNGFQALLRSADKPEALRGPNCGISWCDEWAHWQRIDESWSNVQLCVRIGKTPTHIITSTPLPLKIVKELVRGDFGETRSVFGHTQENISSLAPKYVQKLMKMWGGTTLGLQELGGQILEQNEHALWWQETFGQIRKADDDHRGEYFERALSIDPAGGGHRRAPVGKRRASDETGMMVTECDNDQVIHFLEDASEACPTRTWANRAVHLIEQYDIDVVFAEVNYGGGMVEDVLKQTPGWDRCGARLVLITARRSKGDRARIAVGHYEKGKVFHVGPEERWRKLEGQQCTYDPTLPRTMQDSPDRMDAAVWAILGHIRDGEAAAGDYPGESGQSDFWDGVGGAVSTGDDIWDDMT